MQGDESERSAVLCGSCDHYRLERIRVAGQWREDRRCIKGMMFAGERTECSYYCREPGSDGE